MSETAASEAQTGTQQATEGGQTTQPSGSGQAPGQQTNGTTDNGQTPKTFDAAYVHSIRDEAKQNRLKAEALQAQLDERDQASMSELQKTQAKLTTEKQQREAAELRLARFEIAAAKEIPAEWVDFLHGNSREELESNADKLKERIGGAPAQQRTGPLDFGAGARPSGGQADEDFNSVLRRAAGR